MNRSIAVQHAFECECSISRIIETFNIAHLANHRVLVFIRLAVGERSLALSDHVGMRQNGRSSKRTQQLARNFTSKP